MGWASSRWLSFHQGRPRPWAAEDLRVGMCDASWGVTTSFSRRHNGDEDHFAERLIEAGDVIGCVADLDAHTLSFSLNGSFEAPFGVAFRECDFALGVVPAITIEFGFICRVNFGQEPLKFAAAAPNTMPVKTFVQRRLAEGVRASAGARADKLWPTTGQTVSKAVPLAL